MCNLNFFFFCHDKLRERGYKNILNPFFLYFIMKIKDLPEQNRPRERFLKHGPSALSDAELFAIILRTGSPNENVIDMSNRLIKEYELKKLFDCSLKELQEIKGIGPSKAMQILAMAELGKRYSQAKNPIKKISSAKDVFDLFKKRLIDEKRENFIALHLDSKNKVIKEEIISIGNLDTSIVHPREVFKSAIKESANAIILLHNHPSGDPKPSEQDMEITRQLKKASDFLGIKLIDHVIIGNESYFSFKERTVELN